MGKNNNNTRQLTKEADVSSTVIQKFRLGKQDDIKLSNFLNISHA
jgi:DNA-binding Xre family transcriptional regulator